MNKLYLWSKFSRSSSRNYSVDFMRGIFAIGVMLYHYMTWSGLNLFEPALLKVSHYAVCGFFIISGFSMYIAYEKFEFNSKNTLIFFFKRFLRLAPLYYIAIALVIVYKFKSIFLFPNWILIKNILMNVFFIFGFFDPAKSSVVVAGWSIGTEWVFYFFFPILMLCIGGNFKRLLVLSIAMLVLSVSYTNLSHASWSDYASPVAYAVYFACGMLIAFAWKRYRMQKYLTLLLTIAVTIIFFSLQPLEKDHLQVIQGIKGFILMSLCFLIVALGSFYDNESKFYKKAANFLGEISYPIYLLHFFLFMGFKSILHNNQLAVIISLTVIFPTAYFVYVFLEKPFLQYSKMLTQKSKSEEIVFQQT